jgi:Leucine-rich repeat (LRR) protein
MCFIQLDYRKNDYFPYTDNSIWKMATWKIEDFNRWVSDGCQENNSVTILDLNNCEFSSLPESIGKLKALRKLDISHNQLSSLPESIAGTLWFESYLKDT